MRREILASIPMIGQDEVCARLGLSPDTLRKLEAGGRVLRFDQNGGDSYPLFQFDISERRVHPTLLRIMELRADDWGGEIPLLYWLARPNRSLGGARPCERLDEDPEAVLQSFAAEIAEPFNG